MEILLYVLAAISFFLGIAGCFLPILPGPPLAYAGLWLLQATDRFQFTMEQLLIGGLGVVLVQVLDYVMPMLGTKYSGGSKGGNVGCVVGTIVGVFFFAPWGILLGPFLGALLGELIGGKTWNEAVKAGFGAFVGFLVGVVLKLVLCGYFLYLVVASL